MPVANSSRASVAPPHHRHQAIAHHAPPRAHHPLAPERERVEPEAAITSAAHALAQATTTALAHAAGGTASHPAGINATDRKALCAKQKIPRSIQQRPTQHSPSRGAANVFSEKSARSQTMSKKPRKKKKTPAITKNDKRYEQLTAEIIKKFSDEYTEVILDNKIVGKSGRTRQIDVDVRSKIAGQDIFIVFECKYYKRRVGIGTVDEVIGKIDDVRAQMGVIVSDSGFDQGAIARAKEHGRIQLCHLVDSSHGWLRSKISVPFVVSYTEAKPAYMVSFSRLLGRGQLKEEPLHDHLKSDRTFILEFLRIHGLRAFSEFHEWIGKNLNELPDGRHTFKSITTLSNDIAMHVTFTFDRVTDTYFKEDVLVGASGLFNAIDQKMVQGKAGEYTFEESHIRTTWTPCTPDFRPPEKADWYRRLSFLSAESASDYVSWVIEQLEARP